MTSPIPSRPSYMRIVVAGHQGGRFPSTHPQTWPACSTVTAVLDAGTRCMFRRAQEDLAPFHQGSRPERDSGLFPCRGWPM